MAAHVFDRPVAVGFSGHHLPRVAVPAGVACLGPIPSPILNITVFPLFPFRVGVFSTGYGFVDGEGLVGSEMWKRDRGKKVKTVIWRMGDGRSLMHVYTAGKANRGKLWLENGTDTRMKKKGATKKIETDSGQGGATLAWGVKTN